MGARPSQFRKAGGGFLNGVDGVITGYRLTDEFNGEAFVPGKKPGGGGDKFHSLFFELSARIDGADEDITQNLFAGNADDWDLNDGLTIIPNEDGFELGGGTPFNRFLTSLIEAGFPEASLSETDTNFEPIIGTRVRFGQAVELGKDGKPKQRVAKKGKFKGRSFDATTTIVEQVYDLPGKKANGTSAKSKPGAKSKAVVEESLEGLAAATLIAVATNAKGKIAVTKLSMAILNELMHHPQREPVRKMVIDTEFLEKELGWDYDAKKNVVTVEVE